MGGGRAERVRSGCARSGHGTYDGQTGTWAGKTSSAPFFCFVLFWPEIVLGVFQLLRTMRTHGSSLIWYLLTPNPEQQDGQSSQHCVARSLPAEKHHFTCTTSCFPLEKHPHIYARRPDHNKDECSWIWCNKWLVVVVVASLAVSSCCVVFLPENVQFTAQFQQRGFDATNPPQKIPGQPDRPLHSHLVTAFKFPSENLKYWHYVKQTFSN